MGSVFYAPLYAVNKEEDVLNISETLKHSRTWFSWVYEVKKQPMHIETSPTPFMMQSFIAFARAHALMPKYGLSRCQPKIPFPSVL